MGRLNSEQIKNILIAKGYAAVDISSYENKNSNIIVSCPNGHIITASLEAIERPSFKCPKCIGEQFESSAANGVVPEKCGYRIEWKESVPQLSWPHTSIPHLLLRSE